MGSDEPDETWPRCLRGEVAEGLSLLVYEGDVEELPGCAERLTEAARKATEHEMGRT